MLTEISYEDWMTASDAYIAANGGGDFAYDEERSAEWETIQVYMQGRVVQELLANTRFNYRAMHDVEERFCNLTNTMNIIAGSCEETHLLHAELCAETKKFFADLQIECIEFLKRQRDVPEHERKEKRMSIQGLLRRYDLKMKKFAATSRFPEGMIATFQIRLVSCALTDNFSNAKLHQLIPHENFEFSHMRNAIIQPARDMAARLLQMQYAR